MPLVTIMTSGVTTIKSTNKERGFSYHPPRNVRQAFGYIASPPTIRMYIHTVLLSMCFTSTETIKRIRDTLFKDGTLVNCNQNRSMADRKWEPISDDRAHIKTKM